MTSRATSGHRRPAALAAAALAALLLPLTACGVDRPKPATTSPTPLPSPSASVQPVAENNFGYTWPLTVDHGTLECRTGNRAVFTAPDSTAYALNDEASQSGLPSVEPVRLTGSDGHKVSLGPLLSRALKLCRFAG
ncbi:DUF2511 domain-containing protein [Streptomyces sp. SP17BM10]|uniref:DUF2511 domain-containing protein n=1 Tax=Streptomyces sp. SP17BM10 TaxID=3002530 RepID=UPI002E7738F1|nr:DUF2511 domain-containing protein [Streptomyces sp. SP17BM10]MEE1786411.1 DUF2511 domain-containing protein [Streptomyces sp. SP17BM10]